VLQGGKWIVLKAMKVQRHLSNFDRDDAPKLSNSWTTFIKTRRAANTESEDSGHVAAEWGQG
jgi:hypothetical protein